MIWRLALTASQIHIILSNVASRSKVNIIMQTCEEARNEYLSFNLPYFRAIEEQLDTKKNHMAAKNCMNYEHDIILFPDESSIPEYLRIYCSLCKIPIFLRRVSFLRENRLIRNHKCPHKHRLGGIAMCYKDWEDSLLTRSNRMRRRYPGLISDIYSLGDVRHLYLVVCGDEYATERDVHFTNPDWTPENPPSRSDFQLDLRYTGGREWKDLAKLVERTMEDFKIERAEARRIRTKGSIVHHISSVI